MLDIIEHNVLDETLGTRLSFGLSGHNKFEQTLAEFHANLQPRERLDLCCKSLKLKCPDNLGDNLLMTLKLIPPPPKLSAKRYVMNSRSNMRSVLLEYLRPSLFSRRALRYGMRV